MSNVTISGSFNTGPSVQCIIDDGLDVFEHMVWHIPKLRLLIRTHIREKRTEQKIRVKKTNQNRSPGIDAIQRYLARPCRLAIQPRSSQRHCRVSRRAHFDHKIPLVPVLVRAAQLATRHPDSLARPPVRTLATPMAWAGRCWTGHRLGCDRTRGPHRRRLAHLLHTKALDDAHYAIR